MPHIWKGCCKTCGKPFYYSDIVERSDTLRGLSPPERCPKCVRANRKDINSVGAAYWRAPLETDNTKRCWGHFGLGRLVRNRVPPERIEYPGEPIASLRSRFATIETAAAQLIHNLEHPDGTQVSVLIGPTGTGKSTWVPYRMLRSQIITQRGPICVTQPRTVTLRCGEKGGEEDAQEDTSTPGFIARYLLGCDGKGVGAGREVGVLFRGDSERYDRYNKLVFVTDGILIKWLLTGEIARFSVVMIDEAHELSANMALIFTILQHQLPRYRHLRVVIASATADVEMFRNYFGGSVFVAKPTAPTSGTLYPVFDRWPDEQPIYDVPVEADGIPIAVASLVQRIRTNESFTRLRKPYGDILVFVPTIRHVNQTVDALTDVHFDGGLDLKVLPCHAQLTDKEISEFKQSEADINKRLKDIGQPEVFTNHQRHPLPQRVIVATNYAETSVTISNLSFVIDSGLILEPKWETASCSTSASPVLHTQAGCTQRRGRLGRVQEGEYFRLYTKNDWDRMIKHPVCSLSRERLDSFLLKAKIGTGVHDLNTLQWIGRDDQRDGPEVERCIIALKETGAIDDESDYTNHGVELEEIQADSVDLMHFFSESDTFACTLEVATFLAMCEERKSPLRIDGPDGLIAFAEWRENCYDDLEFYLRIFHQWTSLKSELWSPSWAGEDRTSSAIFPPGAKRQLWNEARKKGLEPSVLGSMEDARVRNLKRLSDRTHTHIWDRDLDLDRLHRVRLVLARCMPRWIYSANAVAGRGVFIPWKSELNPCVEPLFIERASACYAKPDLASFVCFARERKQTKDGSKLVGKHIVRVAPDWLKGLEEAPVAVALRLRQSLQLKHHAIEGCKQRVAAAPRQNIDAFLKKFRKADQITATVLRPPGAEATEGTRWILAIENQTGTPVLLEKDRSYKEAGAQFDALVVKIDRDRRRIVVSQTGLYKPGDAVHACAGDTYLNEAGEVCARFAQLEGNVRGFLHQRNVPLAQRDMITSLQSGTMIENLDLVVLRNDPIHGAVLGTRSVFENHYRHSKGYWQVGQLVGTCLVEPLVPKEEEVIGLNVEIAAGIWGYVPCERLSFADRRAMASWHPGVNTPPLVIESRGPKPDQYRLAAQDVVEAARLQFKPGQKSLGIVTGFRSRPETNAITTVEVELAPGRRGVVPTGLWMWGLFDDSKLYNGAQAQLEVVTVPPQSADIILRRKARFSKESRLQVVVTRVEEKYVLVDLGDEGTGLVPGSEVSWEQYRSLAEVVRVGDQREARIIDVDEDSNRLVLSFKDSELDWFSKLQVDDELDGVVAVIQDRDVLVDLDRGGRGRVHISEISWDYLNHPDEALHEGQRVRVKIKRLDQVRRQVELSIKALKPRPTVGQELTGRVSALTEQSAVVDLGEYGSGRVHISEISWAFVKDPADCLQVDENVSVLVIGVSPTKLSMKQLRPRPILREGLVLDGSVSEIKDFGAFVDLGEYGSGLVHISEISCDFVTHPTDKLSKGDRVRVLVLKVEPKVALSIKRAQ